MIPTRTAFLIPALAFVTAACGGAETEQTANTSDTAAASTPGMSGMQGMQGMQGMGGMHGMQGGMMGDMMGHMNMMEGVSADSMKAMVPMHRQMAANMLAQMNKEMRDMNMQTTPEWNATVDSLRADLKTMPELSGSELQNQMKDHHRRMMRLMEMHRGMMSNTSM